MSTLKYQVNQIQEMKKTRLCSWYLVPALILILIVNTRCATTLVRELRQPPVTSADSSINDVRVHMNDGSLYVLDIFDLDNNSDTAYGFGVYYDKYRDVISTNTDPAGQWIDDRFSIALPDIALVEVNQIKNKMTGKILGISLLSVATISMTAYCLANPKACFGSCPTFYFWDGTDTTLMAEGFSSSILRKYESDDIDMLYHARPADSTFTMRLTNEALETHVIRYANLMLLPRGAGERVFATEEGEFFQTSDIHPPESCKAPEGNSVELMRSMDKKERYSLSDGHNLISKESVELTFTDVPDGEIGLILGCRQTFMTTYLFYQGLAYLGRSAGYFAARIESGDRLPQRKFDRIKDLLGAIEVFIQDSGGRWIRAGEISESGPIASDVHLIKLPETGSAEVKIKLRMTKGLWRIDYAAVGRLVKETDPIIVEPSEVVAKNNPDTGAEMLMKDRQETLITLPGDVYEMKFRIPDPGDDYDMYLKSRGYYLEWMRETWLEEENHFKAALFFGFPGFYLRHAGSDFKKVEDELEDSFWNSRYVRKN